MPPRPRAALLLAAAYGEPLVPLSSANPCHAAYRFTARRRDVAALRRGACVDDVVLRVTVRRLQEAGVMVDLQVGEALELRGPGLHGARPELTILRIEEAPHRRCAVIVARA